MKKLIPISEKDLKSIVGKEFDQFLDDAKHNCYCSNCSGNKEVVMIKPQIFLDSSDDLLITGSCKNCNEMLVRQIELKEVFASKTSVIKKKILKK